MIIIDPAVAQYAQEENYRVVQAWTLTRDGAEKRAGWDLLRGDEWCQRFWLKRDAMAAMRQVQAEESAATSES